MVSWSHKLMNANYRYRYHYRYRYYYSNYDYRYRYYYSNYDYRYHYYKQIVGKGPTFGPRRTRGFPQIGPNLGPERQGDLCNRAGERQGHSRIESDPPTKTLDLQLLQLTQSTPAPAVRWQSWAGQA